MYVILQMNEDSAWFFLNGQRGYITDIMSISFNLNNTNSEFIILIKIKNDKAV